MLPASACAAVSSAVFLLSPQWLAVILLKGDGRAKWPASSEAMCVTVVAQQLDMQQKQP